MSTLKRREIHAAGAERAAADAFLFGYPLVLMNRMRGKAPANTFVHERVPARDASASAPRLSDTLASSAWLDLGEEPVVLSVPDCHGQYYVISLIDMWTNVFASIGPRTTGTGAASFAVGDLRWNGGALPAAVLPITAPTGSVRLAVQTQLDRRTGGRLAHVMQDGYRIDRLSEWRHSAEPAAGGEPGTSPSVAAACLERMDPATFFAELAALLVDNPPRRADRTFVEGLRSAGLLAPGRSAAQDRELRALQERGMRSALVRMRSAAEPRPDDAAGQWQVRYGDGPYATDYLRRAAAAYTGRFMASAGDEVPAFVSMDLDGEPLRGGRRYLLRFDADEPPPVKGFWSLACCADPAPGGEGHCRSRIGSEDGLTLGLDGSLSIYIESLPPAGRELRWNWLPAPDGEFSLVLRLFWPLGELRERRWSPPAVTRIG